MKLALLSNVTVELLARALAPEHAVWTPPGFGAWMEIALAPPTEMIAFDPDVIYLLLDSHFGPIVGDVTTAESTLTSAFPRAAVCVLDVTHFAADFGASFYDERMWKLGRMPWSILGLQELKKVFALKKVLALDLDNTVWKGVAGEDGPSGVRLNESFWRDCLSLKDRGILLTALSKNNLEDVRWFFAKDDPFAAKAINWESKGENLTRMARELNLGCDSFVFVDDNPAERAEMRARHPEVLVADFPPQLTAFFPRRAVTEEDRVRTKQYQSEARRRAFAVGQTIDDYLKGLEIWTEIHPIREDEIPRVAQLSQKTNQFNVCANRYSEDDVRRFAADSSVLLLTLHTGDRFGDLGLIAFILCKIDGACAEIIDFVMSCRAMNRRLEMSFMMDLEQKLIARGVQVLSATWRRTAKNAPVESLFDQLGFSPSSVAPDERRYKKRVSEGRPTA